MGPRSLLRARSREEVGDRPVQECAVEVGVDLLAELRQETDDALALTGKDVGTPIIQFHPPEGVAFFGPVISRLPREESAAELWDHVVGLARFPGFAELKRSLRERPQLRSFGIDPEQVGSQEDWHAGSCRQKK